ncbi:hypothetical protein yrohd0001_36380 [Yersinia rohdei ATCC 43380]|nr:hypothetical protein yrohd0001_36380 [Yersinia rohdei ATCC 43380]
MGMAALAELVLHWVDNYGISAVFSVLVVSYPAQSLHH